MVEYDKDGWERLCQAVVVQAVKDYRMACRCKDFYIQRECANFFLSDWFGAFSRLDGKALLEKLNDG